MIRTRIAMLVALVLSLSACSQDRKGDDDPARVKATQARNADKPDTSQAPGVDEQPTTPAGARSAPLQAFNLRSNQVRTRHLIDGTVTAGKLAVVATTVTVALGAATGSSAADPSIAGGFLIACTPAGNQDQFLDNAVLNADGSITLTLAANAVAINTFRCASLKPNTKGIS